MTMSNTSIGRIITSAVVTAGMLVGSFAVTGAAQANDFHGRGQQHYQAPAPRHVAPPVHSGYGHYAPQRHHNNGDKIAKGVAIGVGALILGGILASEANRHRNYD